MVRSLNSQTGWRHELITVFSSVYSGKSSCINWIFGNIGNGCVNTGPATIELATDRGVTADVVAWQVAIVLLSHRPRRRLLLRCASLVIDDDITWLPAAPKAVVAVSPLTHRLLPRVCCRGAFYDVCMTSAVNCFGAAWSLCVVK